MCVQRFEIRSSKQTIQQLKGKVKKQKSSEMDHGFGFVSISKNLIVNRWIVRQCSKY